MSRTLEQLEAEFESLVKKLDEQKHVDPKDLSDLREELIKIQNSINQSSLPPSDQKHLKKKIKRLKERDFWNLFDEDEYEEIDDPNDREGGE